MKCHRGLLTPICRLSSTAALPSSVAASSPLPSSDSEQSLVNTQLRDLVARNFPSSQFCFAYGSKILHQTNNLPTDDTMTDLIFVPRDSHAWHEENLARNPDHYSGLMRAVGAAGITAFQTATRAYCIFNPYVNVEGTLLKYGVISERHLYDDLEKWDTLYVAGRLHKPVMLLHQDPSFRLALLKRNLRFALHTALVLLPERFNDFQLFCVISRLSYFGDYRMRYGTEDPDKVRNIVQPNIAHFRALYEEVITESPFITRTDYGYCQRARCEHNLRQLHNLIPNKLLYVDPDDIAPDSRVFRFDKNVDPAHQLYRKVAAGDVRYFEEAIRVIVRVPSVLQPLRGFITAGPLKSLKYGLAKRAKSKGKHQIEMTSIAAIKDLFENRLISAEYPTLIKMNRVRTNPLYKQETIGIILLCVTMGWLIVKFFNKPGGFRASSNSDLRK